MVTSRICSTVFVFLILECGSLTVCSKKQKLIDSDANQKHLKDIRQEKDATIKKRRAIDEELNALNNEKKVRVFLRLDS